MRIPLFLVIYLMVFPSLGQIGNRYIRNYSALEYNAAKQNFYSTISKDNLIYFANEYGILEYDGTNWNLIKNKSIPYAVRAAQDGRIYSGGVNDLGYMSPNERGELNYISLDPLIDDQYKPYDYIFDIYESYGKVYFSTKYHIFIWDGTAFEVVSTKKVFHVLFKLDDDEFWVKEDGTGLVEIRNNKTELVPGTEILKDIPIYAVIKRGIDDYVIFTSEDGMFRYNGEKVMHINSPANDLLIQSSVYHAISLNNNEIAVATLRSGLVVMDENFNVLYQINRKNGLQNEVVRQLNTDSEGNLWLSTDNGISKIDIVSPLRKIDENSGLEGIVNDLKNVEDKLLAATGIGVYEFDRKNPDQGFKRIDKFTVECSSIEVVGNQVIIGCNDGVFQYDGINKTKISSFEPWKVYQSPNDADVIYATMEHGVGIIHFEDGKWVELGKFKKLDHSITSIIEDENNQLWLGTEDKGIIRVLPIGDSPAEYLENEPIIEYFNESDGLPSILGNKVFLMGHPIFTTQNGIYFHEEERGFYQDSTFGADFLSNPRMVKFIARDQSKNIWIYSQLPGNELTDRNEVSVAKFLGVSDYEWQTRYFEPYTLFDVNTILTDDKDMIWFGGKGGILYYDGNEEPYKSSTLYESLIRRVFVNGDSLIIAGNLRKKDLSEKLPYKLNSLKFNYAAPAYRNEDVKLFQVFLEGYDDEWSSWSKYNEKEYTNLREGSYTFYVRSRNALNEVSEVASFNFAIQPPWFRTFWAYLFYALGSILLIFSTVYIYTFRLNKSKQVLEERVRDRTKELQTANSSIIQQNIEIKNKNEKIEAQKDELKSNLVKIKDATETIELQNKQLKEMNSQLEGMVLDRTKKLNQVVKELRVSNNELDQFIYRSSHDLRGPVARLLGLLYLMRNDPQTDYEEYLNKLENSALELDVILNRLMKTRQIAKKEVKISKVPISRLIRDLQNHWSSSLDGIEQNLTTKINKEHELKTDTELLQILVNNLVENAQKFKDGNKPNPYVNVDISVQDTDHLRVTIEDNGIGISTNIKENIYEMFFVGSNISTGLGLGLYEARVIANKLNGELKLVESSHDRTVFEVSLPLN